MPGEASVAYCRRHTAQSIRPSTQVVVHHVDVVEVDCSPQALQVLLQPFLGQLAPLAPVENQVVTECASERTTPGSVVAQMAGLCGRLEKSLVRLGKGKDGIGELAEW